MSQEDFSNVAPLDGGDLAPSEDTVGDEDSEDHGLTSGEEISDVFVSVVNVTHIRISRRNSEMKVTPYSGDNPDHSSQPSSSSARDEIPSFSFDKEMEDGEMEVNGGVEVEEDVEELALSQKLSGQCTKIGELAGHWIDSYKYSPYAASRAILELILHSSGYTQPLSVQQSLELDQLDPETFSEWISGADVDPPILDDLYIKNLLKFLLLTIVDDVCLDDNLILKRIRTLLEVMSKSSWVSARYTSLMIGSAIAGQHSAYYAKLNTGLEDISVPGNKTVIEEKMTLVKASFSDFMNFVKLRIRDIDLTLRKISFKILCSWLMKGDRLVMVDTYLCHIYWALFEENPTIRCLAIMTFKSLCKSEYVENLQKFVKITLPCVLIRTQDTNNQVAAAAFDTASELYRLGNDFIFHELLSIETMEPIYCLVYEADPYKASRASELLHIMLKNISTSNIDFIFNTLQFTEESVTEIGENLDTESVFSVLAENLFLHAHKELADWNAWISLLLGTGLNKKKRLQELACMLLLDVLKAASTYADNHFPLQLDFPPVPSLDGKQVTKKTSHITVNEEFKMKCSNHLIRMTTDLGPQLLMLWNKFMTNEKCVEKLVAIPQYFNGQIDNLDVKGIACILGFIRNLRSDSATLDAVHRSMACLHHLMLRSEKWKPFTRNLEQILFRDVIGKFFKSCVNLAKQPLSTPRAELSREELLNMRVVKHTLFLTKYFDVSKTSLLNEVPQALKLGASEGSAEFICPTALMCLYILQWQVKDLVEGKHTGDVLKARLKEIQFLSRSLVSQLESMVSAENSLVRTTVYSVLCRVFAMLCPSNAFARNYPQVHLRPPSLEIKEWLNYSLMCQVSRENVPEDENQFQFSSEALQMFCSLLEAQVLNMSYISSILYYFHFCHHPKNYNKILEETVLVLAESKRFSREVADSLMWMQENSNDDVKEISKGLSTVALAKLAPKQSAKKCIELVRLGLSKIRNQRDYCILPVLAPFVHLLQKRDADRLYKSVTNMFRLYRDSDEVNAFLAAFDRRQRAQGVEEEEQAPREHV